MTPQEKVNDYMTSALDAMFVEMHDAGFTYSQIWTAVSIWLRNNVEMVSGQREKVGR